MKRLVKWSVVFLVLGLIVWAVAGPLRTRLQEASRTSFREAVVTRGKIVAVVNATGTIKPVRSVTVGTFVSGPIQSIYVDFNDEVKKDDLLARIDPRIYIASVARDKATLATQVSTVDQTRAKLQQAVNDEVRAKALHGQKKGFISESEMDQYKFNRISLEAQLAVAEAMVDQAKANLDTSVANLEYTEIRSPVDGVVIERKIDPGQTVAASFQTPDMFVMAPDMRKEMHVYASVDESDIGLIREAQLNGSPVQFTVDAYPDDLFEGKVFQIRKNSSTSQNVVTYPVIVSTANADLKLLPGMTASLSFQVGQRSDKLRIPNAALRFFPQKELVHPDDRALVDGTLQNEEVDDQAASTKSAEQKAETRRLRNKRHVWVSEGEFLRAIEIITGLSDSKNTEVVSGGLREGQKLITGIQPRS
jgi:HlyD family secretion protein